MIANMWDNLFKKDEKRQLIDQVLASNFVFEKLNPIELGFLRNLVHHRKYKTGETIFRQGELAVGMYIIVKGSVNISVEDSSDKTRFVTRLNDGDFFGEIALVEEAGRRTATATANTDLSLIGFFKPDLAEIIERSPKTGLKIVLRLSEVLGRRLKETTDRFTALKRELTEKDTP
jgi:CRP/FNR family transcriptional regulator, cyclic AMP receptor protein